MGSVRLMSGRSRLLFILAALALSGVGAVLWALTAGEFAVSPLAALAALFGSGTGIESDVVRHLRLPRAIAVFA
ncbi:MAG: iron ABC transporter permease, partial [Pseudazoarcus pumilus]|nr:iron ABC transporter permease [Pseudazoarcus pumilus]